MLLSHRYSCALLVSPSIKGRWIWNQRKSWCYDPVQARALLIWPVLAQIYKSSWTLMGSSSVSILRISDYPDTPTELQTLMTNHTVPDAYYGKHIHLTLGDEVWQPSLHHPRKLPYPLKSGSYFNCHVFLQQSLACWLSSLQISYQALIGDLSSESSLVKAR